MKRLNLFLAALLFVLFNVYSQSPGSLSYQGVVRNSSFEPVADQAVSFRFSILNASSSVLYSETQNVTTNGLGLVNLTIGEVNQTLFDAIDWSQGGYSLKVECDPAGGNNYVINETSKLNSVPYALYGKDSDADPANELQTISKSGSVVTLSNSGGSFTDAVNDADASITNELISSVVMNGTNLEITEAGVMKTVNLGLFADQALSYNTGTHILSLTGGGSINLTGLLNDADPDPSNELQSISKSGSVVTLSNGGGSFTDAVNDADASTTNEIQTISKSGNIITLSLGGGSIVDEVDDADPDPSNELQAISKSGSTVTLSGGGGSFVDEVNDGDFDPVNELQTLSLVSNQLSISSRNSVNLASYLSPWLFSGSNIYFNTGKVGIGTTTPARTLDVAGNANFAYDLALWRNNKALNLRQDDNDSWIINIGDFLSNGADNNGSLNLAGQAGINLRYGLGAGAGTIGMRLTSAGKIGIGTNSPTGKLQVDGGTAWSDEEPLFEVRNKSGDPVFSVYNNGVRINIEDDITKGTRGGFAIGGFDRTKGTPTVDFMRISPDSIRFNINNDPDAKGTRGGFAIGGFDRNKGPVNEDFMYITPTLSNSGTYNTFLGYLSGKGSTGNNNTFLGYKAGLGATGSYNNFIGYESGASNLTGSSNCFFGHSSGFKNTSGYGNVFLGNSAGKNNLLGYNNVYIGTNAGLVSTGNQNIVIGAHWGTFGNQAGDNNIFIGTQAGQYETGSNKLYIDNSASTTPLIWGDFTGDILRFNGYIMQDSPQDSYDLWIQGGTSGVGGGDNRNLAILGMDEDSGDQLIINYANEYANGTRIDGELKVYDSTPNVGAVRVESTYASGPHYAGVFDATTGTGGCGVYSAGSSSDFFAAGPGINYNSSSSRRWKRDIVVMEGVLEKIASLEGVYFTWDEEHGGERDFGFIAEDVAKVYPELTVPDPDAPGYSLGMDYSKMTPILLQAIKEQQKEIEELRQKSDEIVLLRNEIEELKSLVSTLVEAGMK